MSDFEVPEPILSSPFEEPPEHWHIVEGESRAERRGAGRPCTSTAPPGPRPSEGDGDGPAPPSS